MTFLQSCAEIVFMRSFIICLYSVASLLPSSALALPRVTNIRALGEQQGMFGSSELARHMPKSLRSLSEPSELQDRSFQLKEIVILGLSALQRLRSNTKYPVPPLIENESFLHWAKETSKRKYFSDKEFKERIKVRELKRLHLTEISGLEKTLSEKRRVYELNPNSSLIDILDKAVSNCQQACANMEKFIVVPSGELTENVGTENFDNEKIKDSSIDKLSNGGSGDMSLGSTLENGSSNSTGITLDKLGARRLHVAAIYPLKQAELLRITTEREILVDATPEYKDYMDSVEALDIFLESVGLNAAEKNVSAVQKGAGQGRNSRGRSFEDTADSVLFDHLLPRLSRIHECAVEDLVIVRNIKLGMASSKGTTAELDSVICVRVDRPARMDSLKPKGSFCKVLAVVEVKRNPDDIGQAFLGYQKSLAWLSGQEDLYDPVDWQTKSYPKGHFYERPFLHSMNGEVLIFSTESFADLKMKTVRAKVPSEFSLFRSINSVNNEFDISGNGIEEVEEEEGEEEEGEEEEEKGNVSKTYDINENENNIEDYKNGSVVFDQEGLQFNSGSREIRITDIPDMDDKLSEKTNNDESINREISFFIEDLYFVAKDGSLDSVNSKAMSWVLNKISSETQFDNDLNDETAVENLRLRVIEKHPHRLSTYDLIQMYLDCDLTQQLFLVNESRGK